MVDVEKYIQRIGGVSCDYWCSDLINKGQYREQLRQIIYDIVKEVEEGLK